MQRRNTIPPRIRLIVVGGLLLLTFAANAFAAIDAYQLGARYDATSANITFKVWSSRATRTRRTSKPSPKA